MRFEPQKGGGCTEKGKKEKFPLCVKAKVIGPFGATAHKLLVQNKLKLKNFNPLRAAGAALLPLTKTPDFNPEARV